MENLEKYKNKPKFLEFLNKEFNEIAVNSSIEELAEFAFGSIENAVKEFNNQTANQDETV